MRKALDIRRGWVAFTRSNSSALASVAVAVALASALPGCLFVAGAAVGAGALVVTADDSVETTLESPFDRVYGIAVEEIQRRGTITLQTKEFGRLEGDVVVPNDSHVVVKIERLDDATVKLTVSARTLGSTLPDQDTAKAVATSIIESASRK